MTSNVHTRPTTITCDKCGTTYGVDLKNEHEARLCPAAREATRLREASVADLRAKRRSEIARRGNGTERSGSPEPEREAKRGRASRSTTGLVLAVLLILLALAVTPLAAAQPLGGGGSTGPGGLPGLSGKTAPDGSLVNLLAPDPLYGYDTLSDGQTVYANSLAVEIYNPSTSAIAFRVTVEQFTETTQTVQVPGANNTTRPYTYTTLSAVSWDNASYSVGPRNVTAVFPQIADSPSTRDMVVNVDGAVWDLNHLTLPSFLPYSVGTVGGLQVDLLAIALATIIGAALAISLAASFMRKALYAPPVRMKIWAPLSVIVVGLVVFEYFPQVDLTLGTVTWLIYPVPLAVLLFFSVLHHFNRVDATLLLKLDPEDPDAPRFGAWEIYLTENAKGEIVVVGNRWRDTFYGFLGHRPIIRRKETPDGPEGPPQVFVPSLAFRSKGSKAKGFVLKGLVAKRLYMVDHDVPISVDEPHLSFHKKVLVPGRVVPGDYGSAPVRERDTYRDKLTWPHVVTEPAELHLAGVHARDTAAVLQDLIKTTVLSRVNEVLRLKFVAVYAEIERAADALAAERVDLATRVLAGVVNRTPKDQLGAQVESWRAAARDDVAGDKRSPTEGDA